MRKVTYETNEIWKDGSMDDSQRYEPTAVPTREERE